MEKRQRIAVLTSGGDAPGMNSAIAVIAKTAEHLGLDIIAFYNGYKGLLNKDYVDLSGKDLTDVMNRGGTFLGSARCLEFKEPENVKKAVENAKELGVRGMVVIGGDGSFRGARDLSLAGLPTIGIPATIDNDITCSEYCIGYDTALNTVIECLDKINDTMRSHNRCAFVEVMGNKAGYLAVEVAIACGADGVLIAEKAVDIEKDIVEVIARKYEHKKNFMIVVAEGVEKTSGLSTTQIMKETTRILSEKHGIDLDAKVTVLGHVQRGGNPTYKDRVASSRMGAKAVELLSEGIGNRVVVLQNSQVLHLDILEALALQKSIEDELYELSQIISE